MPVEVKWDKKVLFKRFTGHLTTEMLIDGTGSNLGNPLFEDWRYGIFDFTGVTSHDLKPSSIEEAAIFDIYPSKLNPRLKVAIVVTNLELFALAEQYATSPLHNYATKVFNTIDMAKAWLDLPADTTI